MGRQRKRIAHPSSANKLRPIPTPTFVYPEGYPTLMYLDARRGILRQVQDDRDWPYRIVLRIGTNATGTTPAAWMVGR
jgi:hypothetical protein